MKLFMKQPLIFSLLLVAGWNIAHAQSTGSIVQANRIGLSLVDNQSEYTTVGEMNHYSNTLRLCQPAGPYKLTASMLNDGENRISIHRIDTKDGDNEIGSISFQATRHIPTSQTIDLLDFYQDGAGAHTGSTTITQDMLPANGNWGTDGTNLIWQASGYAYVSGQGGLTFTVPEGYDDATLQFIIYVGTNARGGYFIYNHNNAGWRIAATATAGGTSSFVVGGMSSGDVISFYGAQVSNSQYYMYQTPDIELIGVVNLPSSYVPTIDVTHDGITTTYQPNDTVDLYSLGTVTDTFSESTADNSHPDKYSYKALYDANVILPSGSATGEDFYASIDFTACTTSNPGSGAITGHNGWEFHGSNALMDDNNNIWAYIQYYGSIIYTLPLTYMGNSVNVTVTAGANLVSVNDDNKGILVINNVSHTFNAGETYTWTNVPVTAGGIIEIKTDGTVYSTDLASITIAGGNGSALNAPRQAAAPASGSLMFKGLRPKADQPVEQGMKKCYSNLKIND